MTEPTNIKARATALRLEGHTCASAAKILGVSRQRVSVLTAELDVVPIYVPREIRDRLQALADEHGLAIPAYLALL